MHRGDPSEASVRRHQALEQAPGDNPALPAVQQRGVPGRDRHIQLHVAEERRGAQGQAGDHGARHGRLRPHGPQGRLQEDLRHNVQGQEGGGGGSDRRHVHHQPDAGGRPHHRPHVQERPGLHRAIKAARLVRRRDGRRQELRGMVRERAEPAKPRSH